MARNGNVVSLNDVCLLTVGNYLSPSNVWSIYRLVPYVHCRRIEYIVHSFICDHFMDISHTDQFLALDEKEMQWLVDNHDIVASEAAVLDGLARWYKHSEHQRENAFKQLFDRLHVSVIGKDVLWEVIKKYELHKVIPDLLKYKVSKLLPRRLDVDELIYQENLSNIALLAIPDSFNCKLINCWMPLILKNMTIDLSHVEGELIRSGRYVVPWRERVYMFESTKQAKDGRPSVQQFNACLDLRSRTCDQRSPPPTYLPFRQSLAVTHGTHVFLLGGRGSTDDTLLSTVYRYDVVMDKWDEAAPMVYGHHHAVGRQVELVLPYNNRYLYVFGQHCEKYDMYTNTWTPIVPPWERRIFSLNGIICNDKIFIFVMSQHEHCCYMYDVGNDTWREPFPQVPHFFMTRSFFGKNFALSVERGGRGMRPATTKKLKFSEMKLGVGKFKLCNIKEFPQDPLFNDREIFHIMVLSRGLRMLIEQK